MSWLDAAIVIVFLFFIVTAFQNGFVRETVSMASAIAGVVLAGFFYDNVADSMLSSIDNVTTKNVIAFLFFIVTAFQNGFVRETVSMASAIAGVVLAGFFYDNVADSLLSSIDNVTTKNVIAFLIIFGGISIAGQLVAMLVHPAVVIMQLGIADQLLGAVFGAVKAFVIIEALLILMIAYPRYDMDDRIRESDFAGIMIDAAEPVLKILPAEFDSRVDQFNDGVVDLYR